MDSVITNLDSIIKEKKLKMQLFEEAHNKTLKLDSLNERREYFKTKL